MTDGPLTTPDYARGLQHQPLDTLTAQVIHQRGHLPVRGCPPATPSADGGRRGCPAPGCTPSPTPWPRRSRPRARSPASGPRTPPRRHRRGAPSSPRPPLPLVSSPRGHRRLAFRRVPAGTRLPGERHGRTESGGVLRGDSTQPARSPPAPDYLPGTKHQGDTASRAARDDHASPAAHARHPPQHPAAPGWTSPPAHGLPEPLTGRQAHRQHTRRHQRGPSPPAAGGSPSFAGTPRRKTHRLFP